MVFPLWAFCDVPFGASLDEAQEAEAIQVVNAILELREQQSVQSPAVMCKIYFTTAMLQFILGDMPKVRHDLQQLSGRFLACPVTCSGIRLAVMLTS